MATEVFMPKAGMDMQEGTIIAWLYEVGDEVRQGEPLLEIETDKVTMEVEAPADGVLLCKYFENGAVVPVVTIIGYIGQAGESVPEKPSMAGGRVRAEDEERLKDRGDVAPERNYDYRVAVIGGGTAGYTAALRAAELGGKTVLFERTRIGGTGAYFGSISLMTYVRNAKLIDEIQHASERGIIVPADQVRADAVRMAEARRAITDELRSRIRERLHDSGVEIVSSEASMIGRHHIRAGQKTYRAEKTILCLGSDRKKIEADGAADVGILDPEELFELEQIPEKLVIIGGGVTGCEIASAWSRFGSEVSVIEERELLLPTFDEDVSREIEKLFEERKIRVITEAGVDRFEKREGKAVVVLRNGRELEADTIVSAIGRKPNYDGLGVLNDEIDFERGKIMVDEYCRTGIDDVFACGDITNRSILAHSAIKMGEAAASTACGSPKEIHLNRAPLLCRTIPEAAGIGLTERQAAKQGEILVGRYYFCENSRAAADGNKKGFIKVIADRGYGEILGVHIVGATACEMIVEAKTMMDMEITVYEAAEIMHPHPSWSEAFMEACADAIGTRLG